MAKRSPCPWCGDPAGRECDGPVIRAAGDDSPHGNTCSAPVCSRCSTSTPATIHGYVCSRGRGGKGCEPFDNATDLCPFCSSRVGQPSLERADHDAQRAAHVQAVRPSTAFIVGVVTGGRDYWPTLAELEHLAEEIQRLGVTDLRDGDCPTGLDRIARGYIRSRGLAAVEKHPANWKAHGNAAGPIRNATMLDGTTPGVKGRTAGMRARVLFAFAGNDGTADCRRQAGDREIEVVEVKPVAEPRPWNMHHRWRKDQPRPPGLIYVGRSRKYGGPSPLGNPFPLELLPGETRATAAPRILGMYRRWLWGRMQAGDRDVLDAIDAITADSFLGCTCHPAHCHVKILVDLWRWRQGIAAAGQRSSDT